jgi:hypothetical protein
VSFELVWQNTARQTFDGPMTDAANALRRRQGKGKASRAEGLFKQVHKCIALLADNPRHPGLKTHEFHSIAHPYDKKQKVFEAYVQNRTPGAYRVFWCYGPQAREITVIAITPHP